MDKIGKTLKISGLANSYSDIPVSYLTQFFYLLPDQTFQLILLIRITQRNIISDILSTMKLIISARFFH